MKPWIHFIFELSHLKRIRHEGWRYAGVEQPESVAEHSVRAAQIGFLLAENEGVDPYRVASMLIFHDMGECRIGDIHKVANRYVQADEAGAIQNQTAPLGKTGEKILGLWREYETRSTPEGKVAKDADLLEQAFTAKEYLEIGHSMAEQWIRNVENHLQTPLAKEWLKAMEKTKSTDWWQGIKKLD